MGIFSYYRKNWLITHCEYCNKKFKVNSYPNYKYKVKIRDSRWSNGNMQAPDIIEETFYFCCEECYERYHGRADKEGSDSKDNQKQEVKP